MSKSDNIWVTKVREKLTSYSPQYNASDWDTLKKDLPKTKGWLGLPKPISNWIQVILLVSATTIAAYFIVKTYLKTDNSNVIENTKFESSREDNVLNNDSVEIQSSIHKNELEKITRENKSNNQNLVAEESEKTVQTIPKEIDSTLNQNAAINKRGKDSTNKSPVLTEISNPETATNSNKENFDIKKKVPDFSNSVNNQNKNSTSKLPENKSNKVETASSNKKEAVVKQDNYSAKSNSKQTDNPKIESKSKKNSIVSGGKKNNVKSKKSKSVNKNKSRTNKNKSSSKQKLSPVRKKEKNPTYLGVNTSLDYLNNIQPYKSKMNISGGLTFEKFISEKSSIELGVQLHINNHNYSELIHEDDSTVSSSFVLNPGDSIPSLVEKIDIISIEVEKTHSMNLAYLDLPLVYNRYFIIKKEMKLGASLGISNKYFLNYKIDGNKVDMYNKFYFAQAGLIGLKYQQQINKNLNLNINPFVEIPFRDVLTQNISWINYGLNVNILFQINKTNK